MNPRRILLPVALGLFAAARLPADVYFSSAPSNVDDNQSYYIEAVSWDYGAMDNTVYKNGNWFTDSWGQGASAGAWTSDSGPTTVDYMAECYNWDYGTTWAYASVSVSGGQPPPSNNPPSAWVEVDGYGSGATVVRPYGGSINVTVHYKASDPDGNLQHIRPQVWHPDSGYFTNDNGGWTGQSGGYGEVVRTITLDRNGDWYLWTDAEDWPGVFVNSGAWGDAFRLHVVEGAPPNSAPVITLTSPSAQTITVGTALTISSHATDVDGNLSHHHLDIQRPDGSWNWQGGFANGEPYNGGPVGSAADSTRSASFTFDQVGTWHVRSWANDTNNANLHSATVDITVNQVAGPGVPQNLQVSGITSSSFTLSWSSPGGNVSGYQVRLNNGSAISASGLSYTFTGLASNTSYNAEVQAVNAGGGSGWTGAGVTTGGSGGGTSSSQSIWQDVTGDGILDEIVRANSPQFSYYIDSWYTLNYAYWMYPVDDYWFGLGISNQNIMFNDFSWVWAPSVFFWVDYTTYFNVVFNVDTEAGRPIRIYRDLSGSTVLNTVGWQLIFNTVFSSGGTHSISQGIADPDDLAGTQFFLVKEGKPIGSLQVSLPGNVSLTVGTNGQLGSLKLPDGTQINVNGGNSSVTIPGGTVISIGSGGVSVTGTGSVPPESHIFLPAGASLSIDANGNVTVVLADGESIKINPTGGGSIMFPSGAGITLSSSGSVGLILPAGTPQVLAKAVDTAGKVLSGDATGLVWVVKDIFGNISTVSASEGGVDIGATVADGQRQVGAQWGGSIIWITHPPRTIGMTAYEQDGAPVAGTTLELLSNDDDDNKNGAADSTEGGFIDDDARRLTIDFDVSGKNSGVVTLEVPDLAYVKVWGGASRDPANLLINRVGGTPVRTWDLAVPAQKSQFQAMQKDLWIEGIAQSGDPNPLSGTLNLRYNKPGEPELSAQITTKIFRTLKIQQIYAISAGASTSNISDFRQSSANTVRNLQHGYPDIACPIAFTVTGSFQTEDSVYDNVTDANKLALRARMIDRNYKVYIVKTLNINNNPNVGGVTFALNTPEIVLLEDTGAEALAHEYGHTQGFDHIIPNPTWNLMGIFGGQTINTAQQTKFGRPQ